MMSSFLTARHYHLQENPEYTFLFAGEGSDYYHWVLYCHLYNVSISHPCQQRPQQHAQSQCHKCRLSRILQHPQLLERCRHFLQCRMSRLLRSRGCRRRCVSPLPRIMALQLLLDAASGYHLV